MSPTVFKKLKLRGRGLALQYSTLQFLCSVTLYNIVQSNFYTVLVFKLKVSNVGSPVCDNNV